MTINLIRLLNQITAHYPCSKDIYVLGSEQTRVYVVHELILIQRCLITSLKD